MTTANIIDYVRWRGDIRRDQIPYGEVDYLILSMLSYGKMENCASSLTGKTVGEIYPILFPEGKKGLTGYHAERHDLWLAASAAPRFASLKLDRFHHNFNAETEEQFAAMVFSSGDEGFVVFRGTDGTMTGWKEDINMAFIDEIPSEHDAVKLLEKVAGDYRTLSLSGHSKGGVLAVYSAFRSPEETFAKISGVWSYDGPGLQDHYTKEERWPKLSAKSHIYIPESSVVGMLFTAMASPIIVESSSIGVLQHDTFNWHVMGPELVRIEDTTLSSKFTDMTIKTFFDGCSKEERKVVVNTIYSILELCGEEDMSSLPEGAFRNLPKMISAMQNIPEEDRKIIWELAAVLRKSGSSSLMSLIHRNREDKE